jgi:probable F420-dependent oxidoreductase
MELGVCLPIDEPAAAAVIAERERFDFVASGEHIAFNVPTANSLIWLAAAAGATSRIGLVSSITLVPQYPATLLAKLVASLDHVSGGRFQLGVGVGGEFKEEFRAVGVETKDRGARTDEALMLLRSMLSGETTSFDGRFTSFKELRIAPPAHQKHVPVWISGRSERAMLRASRFGDVWFPYMYTPEQMASSLQTVREKAGEVDRAPESVDGAIFVWMAVDKDSAEARRLIIENVSRTYGQDFSRLEHYLVFGTPEEAAVRIREYRDAGANKIVLSPAMELNDRVWGLMSDLRSELTTS